MSKRYQLIELLSNGRFCSGESLAEKLDISRAAVWKHVQTLHALGLDVHAVRGRGYQLRTPLQLLYQDKIQAVLTREVSARLDAIEVLQSVDSTSEYLRRQLPNLTPGRGRACLAEQQTAGRGRRGRSWVSPFGSSLYLSLAWYIDKPGVSISGLSLAVAVSVARTLETCGVDGLGIKWPNDIFLEGRKLAGILLDLSGESGGAWRVVVGVGINLCLPATAADEIDQPWTDLSASSIDFDRNRLAGQVLQALVYDLENFVGNGLRSYTREWTHFDLLAGRQIDLQQGDRMIAGTARGIDADGALLLEHDGNTASYHAGEVTVRLSG
jgi:BirA family biotin operon repressor/biotin-[acetyl-CoA-carboxylase] ligase